jgi:cytochrome c oxidase assembly protein subunit 11
MTDGRDSGREGEGGIGRNDRVLLACAGAAVFMLGMSYAAVPLYDLFCRVTGFGGTTQVASYEADEILDRIVTVTFDANVNRDLPWRFEPLQRRQTVRIGETGLAFYRVTNQSDRAITGVATYNVTPQKAGVYFNKIECFCFIEQTLQPGESMDMPVTYFVDPAMDGDRYMNDVRTMTLSYTFFESAGRARERQSAEARKAQ